MRRLISVWGIIALYRKQRWVTVVCAILIFMIGFSWLVLGSHFPHDVLIGWLFGGILLWAYVRYWDAAVRWLSGMTLNSRWELHFWFR